MLNELIREARALPEVSPSAASAYVSRQHTIVEHVNVAFSERSDLSDLLGKMPLAAIRENHKNHAAFMGCIYRLGVFELLARMLPWIFRAYHGRGVSYDYFPAEIETFRAVIREEMPEEYVEQLDPAYAWLAEQCERADQIAAIDPPSVPGPPAGWRNPRFRFLASLLAGDGESCLQQAREHARSVETLGEFYLYVVQPAMIHIGLLWEQGEINAAQEHLCSSLVGRVLAMAYDPQIRSRTRRGRIIVACAPEEQHELGAWMVTDLLTLDGWEASYLGANTPRADLIGFCQSVRPEVLALSVSMPYHLAEVKDLIDAVRKHPDLSDVNILLGGQGLALMPDLWKSLGADAYAGDCLSAIAVARRLESEQPA